MSRMDNGTEIHDSNILQKWIIDFQASCVSFFILRNKDSKSLT